MTNWQQIAEEIHRHDLAFDQGGGVYCTNAGCDFYVDGDDLLSLIYDGLRRRTQAEMFVTNKEATE